MIPELARHTEKLIYLFEVLRDGSLQGCARRLGISAATLSYSVKELEQVVGAQLLTRTKKGVSATPAGERLFEFSRKLYRELETVETQLQNLDQVAKHRVRIGTFPSIALYFWPLLQAELGQESQLSISITTKRSREILEALVKHEIDLAITVECFDYAHLVRHELYQDHYAFYVRSRASTKSLTHEVARENVLLYIPDAKDVDRKSLRQHVHGMGLVFREEFELDSFEVISEFVKKGHGIALLPTRVAQTLGDSVRRLKCASVPSEGFGRHRFYLSYRDDLEVSQRDIDLILTAARKAVKKFFS